MQKDELLYDYLLETVTLRKKLASMDNEKQVLQHKQIMNSINIKAGNLLDLLNSCIENLKKVSEKKATIILKTKMSAKSANKVLQLPYTHHDDFLSMLSNKDKFEKNIDNIVPDESDENDDFTDIFKEFEKLNAIWNNQITAEITGCKLSKGFIENINYLKQLDQGKNSADEHKNDSDLGCYPYDSKLVNIDAPCMSQFATSSPILKKPKDDLLKTPE